MSYILQTNHLYKTIDGKDLVADVNIHIRQGEIYGFLGPNGYITPHTVKEPP